MTGIVHDGEADGVSGFAATVEAFRMITARGGGGSFLVEEGQDHGSFSLAVGLADAGAEDFDGALHAIRRNRRSGKEKDAETGVVIFGEIGMREESIECRGREKDVWDAIFLNTAKNI